MKQIFRMNLTCERNSIPDLYGGEAPTDSRESADG
jgi:hypothetical protein